MGFIETHPNRTYIKLAECEVGADVVVGWYKGTVPSTYGDNFLFETEAGEHVVINKSGSLNYKMQAVKVGDFCKVVYEGTEKLTKGAFKNKECHQVKIMVDPERSGAVNVPSPQNEAVPNTTDEATDLF